jgi:hypothetical protein
MPASDDPRAPRRIGRWVAIIFLAAVVLAVAVAMYGLLGPAPRAAGGPTVPAPAGPAAY